MTPEPRTLPRRTVLAASGTAVLAAAAACGSNSAATDSSTPAATSAAGSSSAAASSTASSSAPGSSTAASSTAESSTAESSPAESSTAASSSAAESTPAGKSLATVADVESAGSVVVEGPSGPLLLAAANGSVVAHTAICTHQGCTVAANGGCPCHGSKFNVQTGAVENPPALQPLAEVPVTVSGGQVFAT
ncbi:Rieske (2Fe-2S) protein [Nakamurella sp. GG22]